MVIVLEYSLSPEFETLGNRTVEILLLIRNTDSISETPLEKIPRTTSPEKFTSI
jgi:hypothetical protein